MSQMTAVQISGPGGAFETVNRQVPEPGPHTVRIKIQACGVCHSDLFVKEGHWPGLQYPRVTGHEVAGVIDAVGPGVTIWKKGQRNGSAWGGTADIADNASPVAVEISWAVRIFKSRDSRKTAGMPNI
jgi:D-arabinose 1-dehydrogenase-like Zn-dependent alcohol dehydrogenase